MKPDSAQPLITDLLAQNAGHVMVYGGIALLFTLLSAVTLIQITRGHCYRIKRFVFLWTLTNFAFILLAVRLSPYTPNLVLLSTILYIAVLYGAFKIAMKEFAREFVQSRLKLATVGYEATDIDLKDYPRFDAVFFEETSRQFEQRGFRYVADRILDHVSRSNPICCHIVRLMAHQRNDTWVSIGQQKIITPKTAAERKFDFRIVTLMSELSDGLIVTTSNTLGVVPSREIDGILEKTFPPELTPEELLEQHESTLRNICAGTDVTPTVRTDPEVLRDLGRSIYEKFSRYILDHGLFTIQELEDQLTCLGYRYGVKKHPSFRYVPELSRQAMEDYTRKTDLKHSKTKE